MAKKICDKKRDDVEIIIHSLSVLKAIWNFLQKKISVTWNISWYYENDQTLPRHISAIISVDRRDILESIRQFKIF